MRPDPLAIVSGLFVVYVEPGENDAPIEHRVPVLDAIREQQACSMARRGCLYDRDVDALLDYMLTHWAWLVLDV